MKSNELFKQILDGKIKEGTKIKVINEFTEKQISTIEYKNGRLNWVSGTFDTTFLCSSDIEFVIEENVTTHHITIEADKLKELIYENYYNWSDYTLQEKIGTVTSLAHFENSKELLEFLDFMEQ